jgi:hypothetical protein
MRLGKDVGVYPQRNARANPLFCGSFRKQVDLRLALAIEDQNAGAQGQIHLRRRLAHAREDHPPCRFGTQCKHSFQLTTRDNIETASMLVDDLENRQGRIRLHRITDQMAQRRKSMSEHAQPRNDLVG